MHAIHLGCIREILPRSRALHHKWNVLMHGHRSIYQYLRAGHDGQYSVVLLNENSQLLNEEDMKKPCQTEVLSS
jgi:hypothetical protein